MMFAQVFPHEYRRALRELASEEAALKRVEVETQDFENEFKEDIIRHESDLQFEKDRRVVSRLTNYLQLPTILLHDNTRTRKFMSNRSFIFHTMVIIFFYSFPIL